MKNPFEDFDKAFQPLTETLSWRMDAPPHKEATFRAVVLQGAMESQTAGVQTGQILADAWSVRLPSDSVLIHSVHLGDTLKRANGKTSLTVQQVYEDSTGDFWLICTAEERAPLG